MKDCIYIFFFVCVCMCGVCVCACVLRLYAGTSLIETRIEVDSLSVSRFELRAKRLVLKSFIFSE